MPPGNRNKLSMIIWSLAGYRGEGSRRPTFQDQPDNRWVGGVWPALLIGILPVGLQAFSYLHLWISRAVSEEIGEPADQNHRRLRSTDPAKVEERIFLRRVFDHLGQRRYAAVGREADDPISSLLA